MWAGISNDLRTYLFVIAEVSLTTLRYRDVILEPIGRPYAGAIGVTFRLVQDNVPAHAARIVRNSFDDGGIGAIDWLARFYNLNLTERNLDMLSRILFVYSNTVQDVCDLSHVLVAEWNVIPQDTIR